MPSGKASAELPDSGSQKNPETEFICRIYFHNDKASRSQKYRFNLETSKQFSTLNYEISCKAVKSKKNIEIRILGLKAKNDYISHVQPASANIDFEDLYGEFNISIIKKDGTVNSALVNFNIFKKEIKLIKTFNPDENSKKIFCKIEVDESLNSFSKEFTK